MSPFWHNLIEVRRGLVRRPAVGLVTGLVLGACIAVTAASLSLAESILIPTVPYREPARLAIIDAPRPDAFVTYRHYRSWDFEPNPELTTSLVLDGVAVAIDGTVSLGDSTPIRVRAAAVSDDFFPVLGIVPIVGRTFSAADVSTTKRLAVLSEDLWQQRYRRNPEAVGAPIVVNGQPFVIAGVVPRTARFPNSPDLWIPTGSEAQIAGSLPVPSVVARLRDGVTFESARMELVRITEYRWGLRSPSQARAVRARPLMATLPGSLGSLLVLVSSAALLVLLASCFNAACLMLIRLSSRYREFGIRIALGAPQRTLVESVVLEAVLISTAGIAMALPAAYWLVSLSKSLLPPVHGTDNLRLRMDAFFVSAVIVLLVTSLSVAIPTIVRWTRLRSSVSAIFGRTVSRAPRLHLQRLLVGVQVASAMLLVAAASTVGRTVLIAFTADLGVQGTNAIVMKSELPKALFAENLSVMRFYDRLERELGEQVGVRAVGSTTNLPGTQTGEMYVLTVHVEGRQPLVSDPNFAKPLYLSATEGYFSAVGQQLAAGRFFRPGDGVGLAKSAIVTVGVARALGLNPDDLVGRRIDLSPAMSDPTWAVIVGVVSGEVRMSGGEDAPRSAVYVPFAQRVPRTTVYTVVAFSSGPSGFLGPVAATAASIDSRVAVSDVRTFESIRADSVRDRVYSALVILVLGLATAAVAAIGIFAAGNQVIRQRRRELAIEAALGASMMRLRRSIIIATAVPSAIGLLIGTLAFGLIWAIIFVRAPELGPPNAGATAVAACVVSFVVATACWMPIARRSFAEPLRALTQD